jgi:hypothetical protein
MLTVMAWVILAGSEPGPAAAGSITVTVVPVAGKEGLEGLPGRGLICRQDMS